MNNNKHYYEIDRNYIEAAMRNARRERSIAMWALLSRVFSRPEVHDSKAEHADAVKAEAASGLVGQH